MHNKKLYVLVWLAMVALWAGCIATGGPQPPVIQRITSPLPNYDMQPVSPLMVSTGPQIAQEAPRRRDLVALGPYVQFLPIALNSGSTACRMDIQAARLLELIKKDPAQKRNPNLIHCNPYLVLTAQHRANDMQDRRYFNHFDPDGYGPNWWALQHGCKLPNYYPVNGNSIESIALNYPTIETALEALKLSKGHRPHILGEDQFYSEQLAFGVAVSNGPYGILYVILSARNC